MVFSLAAMVMKSGYLCGLLALLWAQERYCPVDKVFLRWSAAQRTQQVQDTGDTLWVPVVFHVIAADSSRWLPPGRLYDQLLALNRDYAQVKIQFYLPLRGPQGEAACGVTWTISPLGAGHDYRTEEDTLKRLIFWPVDSFVNVWVVENMVDNTIGYARALSDATSLPGIVLVQAVTGNRIGTLRPFDWGRTGGHEMGHVFSLLHPFEGGCAGLTPADCALAGDEICDTPGQRNPAFGCPAPGSQNTCPDQPVDLPDPLDNIMGYVDDSCMTRFTPLQSQRMRTYLLTVGSTLISPENRQARGNALQDAACEAILSLSRPEKPRPHLTILSDRIEITPTALLALYDGMGRCLMQGHGTLSTAGLPTGWYILQLPTFGLVKRFFHPGP
jgi:hypothetical protein